MKLTARRTAGIVAAVCLVVVAGCGSSAKHASSPSSTSASTNSGSSTTAPGSTAPSGPAGPQPGLTATSVAVGNVSTVTGPVPGLFQGTVNGVDAYFAYVNSQGGVNGRHLSQKVGDDALSCNQNSTQVKTLSSQVFAFVGSESIVDNCGAQATAPTTPVIYAEALTPASQNLANGFSPLPLPPGFITGPFLYVKQQHPDAVKSVGVLYGTVAAFPSHAQMYAMKQAGWNVTYQRGFGVTETDFTADVLRMKNQGVKLLWLVNDSAQDGRIIQEANQQGWHPLIVLYNGYDHNILKLAGPAINGVINFEQQAMFLGEDKSVVPAVGTFMEWMGKTHPGFTPDLFSVYGWEAAQMFVQALKAAGKDPTQASMLNALQSIHTFNASGLSAPFNAGAKQPSECWLEETVKNGQWQRVTPKTGFQCSPGGYAHYSGT